MMCTGKVMSATRSELAAIGAGYSAGDEPVAIGFALLGVSWLAMDMNTSIRYEEMHFEEEAA